MENTKTIIKDDLILQGQAVLEQDDYAEILSMYTEWKNRIRLYVRKNRFSKEMQDELKVKSHFMINEFSEAESIRSIKTATKDVLQFLDDLDMESAGDLSGTDVKLIIERLLSNMNVFFKSMYRDSPHKKCSFSEDILHQINIENEYDVQHILYSLLRAVFPEIRKEVNGDNGYSGTRSDLYLERYDITIEIKCTRTGMSEKQLTEELGADAFHYKTRNLYLFIYDKEDIIKNPEAYKMAFHRDSQKDGKDIRVFITRPY